MDGGPLLNLIRRRLTRRTLFRAGGAGVATALVIGTERVTSPSLAEAASLLAAPAPAGTMAATSPTRSELLAADPHAVTGRTYALQPSRLARA